MVLDATVRINETRLRSTLEVSSAIGPKPPGLSRLALTDADRQMRDQFVAWCREANLDVTIDATGSIFARREGRENELPAILIGSHLDTQQEGGRFDGIVGVLGALEVIRTLNDRGHLTKRPLCIVNWTNEEGARFPPPMLASGSFVGAYDFAWAHGITSMDDGRTFGSELERIGYLGSASIGPDEVDSYLELHIEQGPELDREGIDIGIVTQAATVHGFRIDFRGETAHAGTRPMELRKNALVAAARLASAVDELGLAHAPESGMATTARIAAEPNKPGILSHYCEWVGDVRHPDPAVADAMKQAVLDAAAAAARVTNCEFAIADAWHWGGDIFDALVADTTRRVTSDLGYSHKDITSRAGHDAYFLAQVRPAGMIFIPCRDGITHNLHEYTTDAAIAAGANVLLHSVARWANR
jgi:beta-ureidopropionase / N-carbamoyl-L-amino-acid hydrolase